MGTDITVRVNLNVASSIPVHNLLPSTAASLAVSSKLY